MATIKLSDYIMEQEVSTASCDDILMEQAFAEMDVASKLFSAYHKQLLMTEMAVGYAMESDASTTSSETKEKWYKRAWSAIVSFFKGVGKWFATQFGKIRDLFRKNKTVIDKAASAMNDETLAAAVTEEFNNSITEVKGTSDISPSTVLYLLIYSPIFAEIDGKEGKINAVLGAFEELVKILKEGDMARLADFTERDNGPSDYDDVLTGLKELEDIIEKSKSRGKKTVSQEELKEFAEVIRTGKLDSQLSTIVSRANGIVISLNSVKVPTIYERDEKGIPVVDENGNGAGVPGFKTDANAMKVFESWRTAFISLTNRYTVILTTLQKITDTFVSSVHKAERKAGEPTAKDAEAQAKLKKELSEKYKK